MTAPSPAATTARRERRLLVAAGAVAAALLLLVAFDAVATRRELLGLLRDQAASLHHTIAAAARADEQAGRRAEEALSARLLENARLLAELDRQGALDEARLREITERHGLFRVAVYDAKGALESSAGDPAGGPPSTGAGPRAGAGRGEGRRGPPEGAGPGVRGEGPRGGGPHGPGPGGGRGQGRGPGVGGRVLRQILDGAAEATTDVHESRGGRGARLAAGVRRSRGGAIVVAVDATDAARLLAQDAIDRLLADVAATASDVAYLALETPDRRVVEGTLPAEAPTAGSPAERETVAAGRPVLEFAAPVDLGPGKPATLRLGLRLDGVHRAERRRLWLLLLSVVTTLALAGFGVGTAWLRRQYDLLSERHARAEEALRRRDRLAAMGELASTVAHEVRNPLNAIAMSTQRLRREFASACDSLPEADRAEVDELFGVVASETARLDRIVRQFLEYARPPRLAPRPTSLPALVHEAAEAVRSLAASRGLSLHEDAEGAGEATVDPDRLREALDNLLRNAVEATPEGGRVELRARSDREGHVIEVADTGKGIAPEDLPRVFDLYFTTKAEGTGVGLAVAQQVVTAHGGTVEVDSEPGRGTRLTLRLPAQEEPRG